MREGNILHYSRSFFRARQTRYAIRRINTYSYIIFISYGTCLAVNDGGLTALMIIK